MDIQNVADMYFKKNMSLGDIATHYNTYPNKVRRLLVKNGHSLRDKSEAQSLALESGKSVHPTKGRERTNEEKVAISSGVHDYCQSLSPEEKKRLSDLARKKWKAMSAKQKKEFAQKANKALRKSAKEGSKLERYLKAYLDEAGFYAAKHVTGLVPNINLEPDLYVEQTLTIIEVDGLSHFVPIWGEDQLTRVQESDKEKNGLFLNEGYCVIRVKNIYNASTLYRYEQICEYVLAILEEIEKKFPPVGKRLFNIEVKK